MARTALPLSALVANSATGLADPAGTTIDATNGMVIAASSLQSETVPPSYDGLRGLFLRVHNTFTSPETCTIRAGANPPAFRAPIGDLVATVTNATTLWLGPLDLARFQQADGSINIDFAAAMAGTITAFIAPRTV